MAFTTGTRLPAAARHLDWPRAASGAAHAGERMKTNYVLIDFENVQPVLTAALASEVFKIIVFVGATQVRVPYNLIEAVQAWGDRIRFIKISGNGRNALDFHIAYYLGELAAAEPEAYFHAIAVDKGMDLLIQHLQDKGIKAARWESVDDIPIVKKAPAAPLGDKLSLAIEYLVRRGSQRPTKLKTLHGSVSALFNPRLSDAETAALLAELQTPGVFHVDGSKLVYGLAD